MKLDWTTAPLASLIHVWTIQNKNTLIADALNYNQEAGRIQYFESNSGFSSGQQLAYNSINITIDNGLHLNSFFVQGPAVTGIMFIRHCVTITDLKGILFCILHHLASYFYYSPEEVHHTLSSVPIDYSDSSRCQIDKLRKNFSGD